MPAAQPNNMKTIDNKHKWFPVAHALDYVDPYQTVIFRKGPSGAHDVTPGYFRANGDLVQVRVYEGCGDSPTYFAILPMETEVPDPDEEAYDAYLKSGASSTMSTAIDVKAAFMAGRASK